MVYWQGKVALVTGGSSGFGLSLATTLVRQGARVILTARDPERLHQAARELQESPSRLSAGGSTTGGSTTDGSTTGGSTTGGSTTGGSTTGGSTTASSAGSTHVVAADVTSPDEVQRVFERIRNDFGQLDALFNIAGQSDRGLLLETTPQRLQELWDLNVMAALHCARAAQPLLSESRGHLVFMGSLAAKSAARYLGGYCCTKFPLAAAAQQLRLELHPTGIHVLLVCPGPIARPDAGARYAAQSAGLPESARQPGGGVKLPGIDPARLADQVLTACQRRQAELVVPGKARLLFAISQLWPSWGDAIIRKKTSGSSPPR
jgi:uncharacterized protein